MSSIVFEVLLRPDPALRKLVHWSGVALLLTGLVLVALLPVLPAWRLVLGLIWLLDCLRELHSLRLGRARVDTIVLDSKGHIAAIDGYGERLELALLTGSMVLPSLAWIRVKWRDGTGYGELLTRWHAGPENWHRLQLLWHQSREAFRHRPGP